MSQPIELVIKEQEIVLEVAMMLKELRKKKQLRQVDLMKSLDMSRQAVSRLENGQNSIVDLVQLSKIVNAYGELLVVTTSKRYKKAILTTDAEDEVLIAFAQGRIEEAEEKLKELRSWHYPFHRIDAQCKRDMAMAISYYFNGKSSYSHTLMNDIIMGLSLLQCDKEAEHFVDMYHRIVNEGAALVNNKREQVLESEISDEQNNQ